MGQSCTALTDIKGFRDVDDLRNAIIDACGDRSDVLHITTICGHRAGDTLCVVDFIPGTGGVGQLAARLGGHVFGMNSVVLNLSLGEEFLCPNGSPTTSPHPCSCSTRK